MPENDRTDTEEENISLDCVQDDQKDGRESLIGSGKPLLSASMVQKRLEKITRFVNDLKNNENQILIFSMRKILPLILSSKHRMIGSEYLGLMSLTSQSANN